MSRTSRSSPSLRATGATLARPRPWGSRYLACSLIAMVLGAVFGAMLGSLIGERLGSAEGEGFIGFLYGLYLGPALGLPLGLLAAWRLPRRGRRG